MIEITMANNDDATIKINCCSNNNIVQIISKRKQQQHSILVRIGIVIVISSVWLLAWENVKMKWIVHIVCLLWYRNPLVEIQNVTVMDVICAILTWKDPTVCVLLLALIPNSKLNRSYLILVIIGIVAFKTWAILNVIDGNLYPSSITISNIFSLTIPYSPSLVSLLCVLNVIIQSKTPSNKSLHTEYWYSLGWCMFILDIIMDIPFPVLLLRECIPSRDVVEIVEVIPHFAIHLTKSYSITGGSSGSNNDNEQLIESITVENNVIPLANVDCILFNEAFRRCRVISYLVLKLKDSDNNNNIQPKSSTNNYFNADINSKYIVLFPHTKPNISDMLKILEKLDGALMDSNNHINNSSNSNGT
jgi:hypothetical protein